MATPSAQSPDSRKALIWSVDPSLPSFRLRLRPTARALEARGWRVEIENLADCSYYTRIIDRRHEIAAADVVVLAKLKLGHGESWLLRRWARRVVFDFDDSIHLRKPRGLGLAPERSWNRRSRFAQTCRACDLVLAGNQVLADTASAYTRKIEIVPTAVDCDLVSAGPTSERAPSTVVWIGLRENLVHLDPLRPVFAELARRLPRFRLRVVSSVAPEWADVPIEFVPWSQNGEGEALASASVGIMPLSVDDWSRGKCSFKLLQYMAAGLPCVATAVGMNRDVVENGVTGFLVDDDEQWLSALDRLLSDQALVDSMGRAGRLAVEARFDQRPVAERVADLLEGLAKA